MFAKMFFEPFHRCPSTPLSTRVAKLAIPKGDDDLRLFLPHAVLSLDPFDHLTKGLLFAMVLEKVPTVFFGVVLFQEVNVAKGGAEVFEVYANNNRFGGGDLRSDF